MQFPYGSTSLGILCNLVRLLFSGHIYTGCYNRASPPPLLLPRLLVFITLTGNMVLACLPIFLLPLHSSSSVLPAKPTSAEVRWQEQLSLHNYMQCCI